MPAPDLQAISDSCAFHRALGIQMRRTDQGITLESTIGADFAHAGERPTVHGGIVATLLDTAATFALMASTHRDWTTVDLRIDYLRPTPTGNTVVTGEVLRAGRTIGRSRAALFDSGGVCCAVATGTFAPGAELSCEP